MTTHESFIERSPSLARSGEILPFPSAQQSTVSKIRLTSEPYVRTIPGTNEIVDCTQVLDILAESVGYEASLDQRIAESEHNLKPLHELGYRGLYRFISEGRDLSYEQAFSLMTQVCRGSNKLLSNKLGATEGSHENPVTDETLLLQAVSLMSGLAGKEGYHHLTAEEIAGLVSAVVKLDTITHVHSDVPLVVFGGMGGDKGYDLNDHFSKLFSSSTMGAIALSVLEPVHKHHSYPNTSKVAGQSAIEEYGARSDFTTLEEMESIQGEQGLLMSSCHTIRTVHTISHKLKGETINHVVGPLALPIAQDVEVSALIGVNEKVHPQTIIDALLILKDKGIQNYGSSVAFCGTNLTAKEQVPEALMLASSYYESPSLKEVIRLDEVAPPPYVTLASFLRNGESVGSFIIVPDDFYEGLSQYTDIDALLIENSYESIMSANTQALRGEEMSKTLYLAMTVALGLFTKRYLQLPDSLDLESKTVNKIYLRRAFQNALQTLLNGSANRKKDEYVNATKLIHQSS